MKNKKKFQNIKNKKTKLKQMDIKKIAEHNKSLIQKLYKRCNSIYNLLICARNIQEDCVFYKTYLPLDIFKIIIKLSITYINNVEKFIIKKLEEMVSLGSVKDTLEFINNNENEVLELIYTRQEELVFGGNNTRTIIFDHNIKNSIIDEKQFMVIDSQCIFKSIGKQLLERSCILENNFIILKKLSERNIKMHYLEKNHLSLIYTSTCYGTNLISLYLIQNDLYNTYNNIDIDVLKNSIKKCEDYVTEVICKVICNRLNVGDLPDRENGLGELVYSLIIFRKFNILSKISWKIDNIYFSEIDYIRCEYIIYLEFFSFKNEFERITRNREVKKRIKLEKEE